MHFTVPPQVLSLVDKEGVETIRPGEYDIQFGVEGAAEGTPAKAKLHVSGEPRELFSLKKIRAAAAARARK